MINAVRKSDIPKTETIIKDGRKITIISPYEAYKKWKYGEEVFINGKKEKRYLTDNEYVNAIKEWRKYTAYQSNKGKIRYAD